MAKLKRVLGFKAIVLLSINAIMGTGIFFLPAIGASYAGPASMISWIVTGIVAILTSFIFAELASMHPKAGGVFEFTKQAFGEFPSFMTGWISWLVANITVSMLIVGSLYYLFPGSSFLFKILLSFIMILIFNYVSYKGIKSSVKILILFAFVTIFLPLLFITIGLPKITLTNFSPFFVFPMSSIFIAMFLISETFFGYESITFLSEETKNPRKVIPKALIYATLVIVLLSISLVFVTLGVMHWSSLGSTIAPFSLLAKSLFGNFGESLITLLIFVGIVGSVASWIVTTPRLLMGMAREKLFLHSCQKIHEKYKTPHMAILFQAIISLFVIFIALGNYEILLSLLLPLVIIVYSLVILSFIKLRLKSSAKRYFKSPFGIFGAASIMVFNLMLVGIWLMNVENSLNIFTIGLGLVLLGIPIYILVKLQNEKFVEFFYDRISFLDNIMFPLWYGENERKMVISGIKLKKNYRILDYGCGIGHNLKELSKDVCDGKVVALDISVKQLEKCVKKIKKLKGLPNIILIKQEEKKAKFSRDTFDGIISVSILSYQKRPVKFLKMLRKILKPKRKVSILEFGKTFFFSPPDFLKSKKSIRILFKNAGFKNIKIKEKKKLFTTYYFITAEK